MADPILADSKLIEAIAGISKAIIDGPRQYTLTGAADWKIVEVMLGGVFAFFVMGMNIIWWGGKYFIRQIISRLDGIQERMQESHDKCDACKEALEEKIDRNRRWNDEKSK